MYEKNLIILIACLFLASCATQTFLVHSNDNLNESKLSLQKPSQFFIGGIGQHDVIDAAMVCGSADNVGKVETKKNFMNGLMAVLTFGTYTPRQYLVYCKS